MHHCNTVKSFATNKMTFQRGFQEEFNQGAMLFQHKVLLVHLGFDV